MSNAANDRRPALSGRTDGARRGRGDLLLIGLAAAMVAGASFADLTQALATWAQRHPDWPVDSLLGLALLAPLVLAFGARRRAARAWAKLGERNLEHARLEAFFAASSDWFWEIDAELRWTMVSERAPEPLRRLIETAQPWAPEPGTIDPDLWAHLQGDIARQRAFRGFRFALEDGAGQRRHVEIDGIPVPGPDGRSIGYRGAGRDVTAAVAKAEEATRLAERDPATDLPNRASLRERLHRVVSRMRLDGAPAALLCLDLDRFHEINDGLGEAAGDRLIQLLAERLRAALGPTDWLARIGPDQLAVIQSGVPQPESAETLCRQLSTVTSQPFELDGERVEITASIGIVAIASDCESPDDVLQWADIALHRAKALGRGRVCVFKPGMDAQTRRARAADQRLRRAMAEGEFEIHYQPQVCTRSRRVVGLEALLRWRHPTHGLMFPKEFLADAEASGLIVPLGEWVLRTACRQAATWSKVRLSVNLSSTQLWHPDLVKAVRRALAESGLAAERLELEISESALLSDCAGACPILDRLKDLGVRIAIDDFGTGYTTLGHLQRFDKIKIDRTLIIALERQTGGEAVVGSLVELGRSLGMQIAAEGIETPEQRALLTDLGCAELQGYHFGRPLEVGEVEFLIDNAIEGASGFQLVLPDSDAAPAA